MDNHSNLLPTPEEATSVLVPVSDKSLFSKPSSSVQVVVTSSLNFIKNIELVSLHLANLVHAKTEYQQPINCHLHDVSPVFILFNLFLVPVTDETTLHYFLKPSLLLWLP
jgi:hypothetical protein